MRYSNIEHILRNKIIYYTIKFYQLRNKTKTKEKKKKNRKALKENIKIQKEKKDVMNNDLKIRNLYNAGYSNIKLII